MIYLLIDSCSWDDLLNEPESSLEYLENLCTTNLMQMVTTTDVLREWRDGKDIVKNRTYDSLKSKYRVANEINKRESLGFKYDLENIDNPSEKIIDRFEFLMRSGLILEPSEKLKVYCTDKALSKKAPFHSKSGSMADALIIYGFLNHFKNRSDLKLWFISKNYTDFGLSKASQSKIHPDIVEDFPTLNIKYYYLIEKAISDLRKAYPENTQLSVSSISKVEASDEVNIDSHLSVFEQLYQYFKLRFREFEYIPNHILLKNTPFKFNHKSSYPYYANYSLHLMDLELYELFKKLGNDKDHDLFENGYFFEDEEKTEKAKFILKTLTGNLIFFITHEKSRGDYINVGFVDTLKCNCSKCFFQRLEYKSFFKSFRNLPTATEDLMGYAYSLYLIGNYAESAESFLEAMSQARVERKFGLLFIIEFNLIKLKNFIQYNFYSKKSYPELILKIDNIKLEKALLSPDFKEYKELVNWLYKEKFYSSSKNQLINHTTKIVGQYYSALKGGKSMNNIVANSITEFQELTYFLHKNKIIYNRFAEFFQLTEIFVEGIIASYGTKVKGNSRLNDFNDWLLISFVNYANSEHLSKMLKRYDIKLFKVELKSNLDASFRDLILNFIHKECFFKKEVQKYCSSDGKVFKNIVDDKFSNILVLMAYGDFDYNFIEDFTIGLIKLFKNESFINWHKIKYLNLFISKKGELISANTLIELFKSILRIPKFHEEQTLQKISDVLEKRDLLVLLNENEFDIISRFSFEKCKICERIHSVSLFISSSRVIESETQIKLIENLIVKRLSENFDFELYYLANIYEVVNFRETYFDKALDACIPVGLIKTQLDFFGDEEEKYIHEPLSRFLNLCFKWEIEFKDSKFYRVANVNTYYEWLIKLDEFDYSEFQPCWINIFITKFYFKRIAGSEKTKNFLENYIKNTVDISIERTYLNIFIRREWDS